jgi:putative oxidoreductase
MQNIAALIMRLGFGGIMLIEHGLPKWSRFTWGQSQFPDPLGLGPDVSLLLAMFAEIVCASLVVLGVLTRLSLVPLIITMGVAFFIVHGADPLQKKELALMYLLGYATMFFQGPGDFSLGKVLANRLRGNRTMSWLLS